jgi:FkbM family methyltransferase
MNEPTLYCCPESMRPHADKVLAGEYDLPAHLELIQAPRTILDIGANVGAFTAWARAKWHDSVIEAYEPMPENSLCFKINHSHDKRVFFYSHAVSVARLTLRIYKGRNNCGECSAYNLGEQLQDDYEDVQAVPAGGLHGADFVKIDTEGCEGDILHRIYLGRTDVVAYEWHGQERRDNCTRIMHLSSANHHGTFVLVRTAETGPDRGIHIWARTGAVRTVTPPPAPSTTPSLHHSTTPPLPPSTTPSLHHSTTPPPAPSTTPSLHHSTTPPPAPAAPPAPVTLSLAIPVYGGVDPHFYSSMLALTSRRGERDYRIHLPPALVGESLVCRARNRLACDFLASDASHLLFIDSDLIFSPEHVDRIAAHAARGVPIVAGLYPKKQRALGWVCNVLEPCPEPDEHDLQPVKYAGTGFLCIAREVFVAMMAAYPEARYDPDDGDAWDRDLWEFFPVGIRECPETGRRRLLSEDWWFCQRARDLGYEVMMDTRIVLKHVGQFIYPFDNIEDFATPVA